MIHPHRIRIGIGAAAAVAAVALVVSGCSSSNPLSSSGSASSKTSGSVTIGSAAFAESETLMYVYGVALQHDGVDVSYKPDIGSREVYIPALKDGSIDIVPDYTGNLLQFFDAKATATTPTAVSKALAAALPSSIDVLTPADAQDQDSLNVTRAFSTAHNLHSIADLAKVGKFSLGANPEFQERAYGVPGLASKYGLKDIDFTAISDSGGPATVKALVDGTVQVADIYTTSPAIRANQLVTLKDPRGLIAAQNVVPVVAKRADSAAVRKTLDAVSAQLTTGSLVAMNDKVSGTQKASPKQVATAWLTDQGLLK